MSSEYIENVYQNIFKTMKNVYSVKFKCLTGSVYKIHIPCFAFSDEDDDASDDAGQSYTHTYHNASHRFLIKMIKTTWKIKCQCNLIVLSLNNSYKTLHLYIYKMR